MGIQTERQEDTLIVKTEGRIDGTNAKEFQVDLEGAIDNSESAVILDLEHLSYISSAGLRVVLLMAKTLRNQNTKFAVCSLSDSIREIFEISGFDQIVSIHDSQSAAISSLNG